MKAAGAATTTVAPIPRATFAPIATLRTVIMIAIMIATGIVTGIVMVTEMATAAAAAMVMGEAAITIATRPNRRDIRMVRETAVTTSRADTASVRRRWTTTRMPIAAIAMIWAIEIVTSWPIAKAIRQGTRTAGTQIADGRSTASIDKWLA